MTTTSKEITMDFQAIYNEALFCSLLEQKTHLEQHGEDMYCGFAWVEIPNGRSPFVNWCRKNNIGRKHWQKGWCIWNPTNNPTQSMTVREVGAQAFADVLTAHGIDAWMGSRAD